jgi:hypothetical protein
LKNDHTFVMRSVSAPKSPLNWWLLPTDCGVPGNMGNVVDLVRAIKTTHAYKCPSSPFWLSIV